MTSVAKPYQRLVSHEQRDLGLHACISKVDSFFHIKFFDKGTGRALFYLNKNSMREQRYELLSRNHSRSRVYE